MRFCPQCSLILEAVEWNGWQIHACRSCGGCWLPKATFEEIVQADRTKLGELDSLFPGMANTGMFEGLPKACPDCRAVFLERIPLAGVEDAQPLTCSQCNGRWLEARETGLRTQPQIPQTAAQPAKIEAEAPAEPAVVEPVSTIVSQATTTPPESVSFVEPAQQSPTPAPIMEPPAAADSKPTTSFRSAETMPDPRPRSKRKSPLGADDDDAEEVVSPPTYQPQRWCPQCRRGYSAQHVICTDCSIGLAEASYRIRCLRCSSENTIAADRCWKCHAPLHPTDTVNPAQMTPPSTDEQQIRQQALNLRQPSKTNSCGTTVFLLAISIAALAAILH